VVVATEVEHGAAEAAEPAAGGPDREALRRVAGGDAEAFAVVVEHHQERLLRLCRRLLGDAEEARDAAQEVFLKAYRGAAGYEPRGQVYTWLYRIAVNHCLNRLRRRRVVRFLPWSGAAGGEAADAEAPPFDPPSEAPGPEDELAARQRWRRVRRAVAVLPDNQRAVLVLVRWEGLSYREAAEVLGISVGAVESRLVRAMRNLGAALGPEAGP
jgi:RNA polymerase sigma-70 factor (ECF subfamily)